MAAFHFGSELAAQDSVIRAARLDAALALAIIGGDPARFAPFAKLYRDSMQKFGHELRPISIHSPGHIAETDEQARRTLAKLPGKLWSHRSRTRLGTDDQGTLP